MDSSTVENGRKKGSSARRPVIGVMTGSFHTDYSRLIAEAICSQLKAEDVDICLFQGLDASRFLNLTEYVDDGFDGHYYSQFEYSKFLNPDLLIVSFGTISAISDPLDLEEFFARLPKVPVILLENDTELPGGIHITVDNYGGMRDCVEHLITDHGCRELLFVSGPRGVPDAELRLEAYRDTMLAHGLPLKGNMIAVGNFTDRVDGLVEELLEAYPKPDAIICANDEMAESAYRVLKGHGLLPGRDVAVTGFDDNLFAPLMDPPLTTVRQMKEEVAEKTVSVIRDFLRGGKPDSVSLSAPLIRRRSCGCQEDGWSFRIPREAAKTAKAAEDRRRIKRLVHENMLTSLMLRNLLDENSTVRSFFRRTGQMLHILGCQRAWIGMAQEPVAVNEEKRRPLAPDTLRLCMVQDGEQVSSWDFDGAPVLTAGEEESFVSLRHVMGLVTAVFPLFYGKNHYGVMVVKLRQEEMLFYYTLSLEIGTGLRYLFMAMDQREARLVLEEKNHILDFSASHDALTGLYNRAGVMNHIYDFMREQGRGRRFVAVMADLDHLKQINDTFGHGCGDQAIRQAAEILRNCLPPDSPLGRTGGDEFTAVFLLTEDCTPESFRQRVALACEEYNARELVPYYEGVSVGCLAFSYEEGTDIPALLKEADACLYRDKKRRRTSVIRQAP
ncbi:MAG: GGDEF domain-containing protein [Oscillospiraceae bacterium]|nr:GGDEF domain-containing protein [Oscillospiraceae bacterium]